MNRDVVVAKLSDSFLITVEIWQFGSEQSQGIWLRFWRCKDEIEMRDLQGVRMNKFCCLDGGVSRIFLSLILQCFSLTQSGINGLIYRIYIMNSMQHKILITSIGRMHKVFIILAYSTLWDNTLRMMDIWQVYRFEIEGVVLWFGLGKEDFYRCNLQHIDIDLDRIYESSIRGNG